MSSRPFAASAMDVARPRRRGIPRALVAVLAALALCALAAVALRSLAAAPRGVAVDRATVVTDVVRRGTLVRSVSAPGVFAPERVRIAASGEEGVVERIVVRPGSAVAAGDVIAQISNPVLEEKVVDARADVAVAQANIASAREQNRAAQLTQRAALADAQATAAENAYQARAMDGLIAQGLVPALTYRKAQIEAEKSRNDVAISRAELAVGAANGAAKLAALGAQLDQARARLAAAQSALGALTVRAGAPGIVQSVVVDAGARVAQGAELARIADTRDLKAVLQLPEGSVHDVVPGMRVRVETPNGAVDGHVAHIAPSAQNGTVAVDVSFAQRLPAGARPDASVNGSVELARLPDVLSLARPAGAADGSALDAFKLVDGGRRAVRVRARLGTGSAERIQVLSGLAAGDTVIVSDTAAYADQPELRLR